MIADQVPKAPKNPPRSLPGVEFGVIVEQNRPVRQIMQEWADALGLPKNVDPPEPIVPRERPYAVEIPLSEHDVDRVRAWATQHFGKIHHSWTEHCCYTIVMGTGDFQMRSRFEFEHQDDAFAFKMRWG